MSDDFMETARKEIHEELDGIYSKLNSCKNDDEVFKKSHDIEKHLHKIKGLAPMMGQTKVGEISYLNDSLLKKIIEGYGIEGIYENLTESTKLMKNLMNDSTLNIDKLKEKFKTKYSIVLE